jgi:hypothetical protein
VAGRADRLGKVPKVDRIGLAYCITIQYRKIIVIDIQVLKTLARRPGHQLKCPASIEHGIMWFAQIGDTN